jgi:prolyl oligopeptidase
MDYPESRRSDHVDVLHGVDVPDPYRWLEELDSEETRRWIAAQNELTDNYLDQIPARARIRERIAELWDFEKYGVPFKRGGRIFFTMNDGLQNQAVLYWQGPLDDQPRPLLDPNALSEEGTVALTGYSVSKDGRLLAYGLSASGSDWQEWRVREVESGRDLDDHLQWVKFSSAAWTHDGRGFFYSRYDEPAEGVVYSGSTTFQKLYYHRLGEPQSADTLVYERPDRENWGFDPQVSDDGRYLVIFVWQGTHRENAVFYMELSAGAGPAAGAPVVELLNEFDAGYAFVGNDGPTFYFQTDLEAPNSRVIAIDVSRPERAGWREIIAESADVLQTTSLISDRFVASYLHDAHSLIKLFDREGREIGEVALPGLGTAAGFLGGRDDPETFFLFTSFTTPGTLYRCDVSGGESGAKSAPFRRPALRFDPDDYTTRQVFYESKDGTRVPMFLTHQKGLKIDKKTPTLLHGYGGFNISQTPVFSIGYLVWMEMGGVFAEANLRGGGEYGKAWHEAGMLGNKQNVFDDFIAAAEWLIEQGHTSAPKLAIAGGSNGGLLVGACLMQRPDLFGACLPAVGVMDMLRFHKFTIGWAWVSDYGSPDQPEEFKTLLAYSPYHNLRPGTHYPATLITTADHDDRVFPGHSFKFAAALQAAQAGPAPALIRIETKAGHGMGKPTSKVIEEITDRWAFAVRALGMGRG